MAVDRLENGDPELISAKNSLFFFGVADRHRNTEIISRQDVDVNYSEFSPPGSPWRQMEFYTEPSLCLETARLKFSGVLAIFDRTNAVRWRVLKKVDSRKKWWRKLGADFVVYSSSEDGLIQLAGQFSNLEDCLDCIYRSAS